MPRHKNREKIDPDPKSKSFPTTQIKIKSIPISTRKLSQIQPPTLKSSQFRPSTQRPSQSIPTLKTSHSRRLHEKQANFYPRTKKQVNFDPHTKIKFFAIPYTKAKLISTPTPISSRFRSPLFEEVHCDTPGHKTQVQFGPDSKNHFRPPHKTKSFPIFTLKWNQFRCPPQTSSLFRPTIKQPSQFDASVKTMSFSARVTLRVIHTGTCS